MFVSTIVLFAVAEDSQADVLADLLIQAGYMTICPGCGRRIAVEEEEFVCSSCGMSNKERIREGEEE